MAFYVKLNTELFQKTFFVFNIISPGLPWWLRCWSICLKFGRPVFSPWVGKICWRRAWQPTPVFLPGESAWTEEAHGLESQRIGYNRGTKHTHTFLKYLQFSSVQFSLSVVSDSLRPHESQHDRPPCPSPSPGVHSDSCPSSPWCRPAIPSSVVPFSNAPNPS